MFTPVIQHLAIDFVRHQRDMRMFGQPCDQLVNLLFRGDAAGRIGGAVDDDQTRAFGDLRQYGIGVERKTVFLF